MICVAFYPSGDEIRAREACGGGSGDFRALRTKRTTPTCSPRPPRGRASSRSACEPADGREMCGCGLAGGLAFYAGPPPIRLRPSVPGKEVEHRKVVQKKESAKGRVPRSMQSVGITTQGRMFIINRFIKLRTGKRGQA